MAAPGGVGWYRRKRSLEAMREAVRARALLPYMLPLSLDPSMDLFEACTAVVMHNFAFLATAISTEVRACRARARCGDGARCACGEFFCWIGTSAMCGRARNARAFVARAQRVRVCCARAARARLLRARSAFKFPAGALAVRAAGAEAPPLRGSAHRHGQWRPAGTCGPRCRRH